MKSFQNIFHPKAQKKLLFLGVKVFLFGICFFLFLLLIYDIWKKYSSKITMTSISYRARDSSTDPYFTVCPMPGFRKQGYFFRRSEFFNNSFNLDEVFDAKMVSRLKNESQYLVTEVLSLHFGRCYCIKNLKEQHDIWSTCVLKNQVTEKAQTIQTRDGATPGA